jgi:hypothetical protein
MSVLMHKFNVSVFLLAILSRLFTGDLILIQPWEAVNLILDSTLFMMRTLGFHDNKRKLEYANIETFIGGIN